MRADFTALKIWAWFLDVEGFLVTHMAPLHTIVWFAGDLCVNLGVIHPGCPG